MKNTVSSGGFAADGFFNGTSIQMEVLRELRDRIPGLVSLVDGGNRYSGTGDHRLAERNCRIHDHDARVGLGCCIRFSVACEGIKFDWKTLRVPLNPLEIDAYDHFHRLLSFSRRVNQIPVTFDEQIQTICLECLIDERALDVELSL